MCTVKGAGNTKPATNSNTAFSLFAFSFVVLSPPLGVVPCLLSLPCISSEAVSYILKRSSVLFISVSPALEQSLACIVSAQYIFVE